MNNFTQYQHNFTYFDFKYEHRFVCHLTVNDLITIVSEERLMQDFVSKKKDKKKGKKQQKKKKNQ